MQNKNQSLTKTSDHKHSRALNHGRKHREFAGQTFAPVGFIATLGLIVVCSLSTAFAQSDTTSGSGSSGTESAATESVGGDQPVLSNVPGQMDSIEQLFSTGGSTEIVEDGNRKDVTEKSSSEALKDQSEKSRLAENPETLSDLGGLSALKDIAVIQKRFQPKTKRFEFFAGVNGVLNDKFFSTFGASGRAAYALSERYAIEVTGILFTTAEKQVTSDLRDRRGVLTRSFVTPLNFYGVDFKWTPIYGKMGFVTENITPFDMYFSAGAGMTGTNQGESAPTVHLGTGQSFALSKGMSLRWDLSWIFYNAVSRVSSAAQTESTYNNLFITVGMSFLFPEASYR